MIYVIYVEKAGVPTVYGLYPTEDDALNDASWFQDSGYEEVLVLELTDPSKRP
jgi:hypothetical protein